MNRYIRFMGNALPCPVLEDGQAEPLHIAALRRYNTATTLDAGDRIFGDESFWRSIAADLEAAGEQLTGDRKTFVLDRARDAKSRAELVALRARAAPPPAIEIVDLAISDPDSAAARPGAN